MQTQLYKKPEPVVPRENLLVDEGIERAVLTCLMKQPVLMVECSLKVKDEDFVNENNRYLYSIMASVYAKAGGKNCDFDITTLVSLAKQKGVEEDFIRKSGGNQYIEYLLIVKDSMVSLEKFHTYIQRLTDLTTKRKLLLETEEFKQNLLDSDLSPEELIVWQQAKISNLLLSSANNRQEIKNLTYGLDKFIKEISETKKDLIGLSTGYKELDKYLEGLRRKTLTIICAPRKTGKTAFMTNIGVNVGIRSKVPTLMISTEMSDEEIMGRILSGLSHIYQNKLIKGQVNEGDKKFLNQAVDKFKNGNFYHLTMRDFTSEKISGAVRKFVQDKVGFHPDGRTKDCLVLFDYIKLPQSESNNKAKDLKEHKVLGQISDSLKILAGDLDIPILTACQTNRGGEVASSYELTWYCDTFAELTKKPQKEIDRDKNNGEYNGNQRLKIVAQRAGEENHEGIDFDYNGAILTYTEIAPKEYHAK